MLRREAIVALIPHQGDMCLLHEVLTYDMESITCRAINHRDPGHVLRVGGVLPAVCGVEYAAQAMAVHGALSGSVDVNPGVLAALRDVSLDVERLDDIAEDLIVSAQKLLDDRTRLMYAFKICAGSHEIIRGRAAVVLSRL
jgi:predicted hotdog family 3-hydroxylacyl-ACP dehydratase